MTIFSSLRSGFLVGTSLAALAVFPSAALAQNECGPIPPGGTVTCPAGVYPDGIDYQTMEDLTLVLQPGTMVLESVSLTSVSLGVDLRLEAQTDVLIAPSQGEGVNILSAQGNVFAGVDQVGSTASGAAGINAASGNGSVVIANSVVTSGDDAIGINAYTRGFFTPAGDVSVTSVSVRTSGEESAGIVASAGDENQDGGSVSIASTSVVTQGDDSVGILATAYGDGDISVVSGSVATSGASRSTGIFAIGGGGDVAITSGAITTTGDDSDGIYAISDHGGVTITSGSVGTAGFTAQGIRVIAGSRDGDDTAFDPARSIVITSTAIVTTGGDGEGISATARNGNITIDSGSVTTSSDIAGGIFADAAGSIAITSGTVATDGIGSTGIYAASQFGTTVISGAVTTADRNSIGIRADALGDGGDVHVSSGTIATAGEDSHGIQASSSSGGNLYILSGLIETNGGESNGVVAYSGGDTNIVSGTVVTHGIFSGGIFATALGDVAVTGDSTTTRGDYAAGLYAASYGDGDVTVTGGAVDTTGRQSVGVDVVAVGGDVSVVSDDIRTTGDSAAGIRAHSEAGAIVITSAQIATGGYESGGIEATSETGAVTIVSGDIRTEGRFGDAIYAQVGGDAGAAGPISITSTGIVTTDDSSQGIVASSRYGNVTISSGTIGTSGERSDGIATYALHGDTIVTSGAITTQAEDSAGLFLTTDDGTIVLDSGRVETFGERSDGIAAYASGPGAVSVLSDAVTTHGDGSEGIVANSILVGGLLTAPDPVVAPADAGDTVVVSGAVRTEGADAGAIIATGTNVEVTSAAVVTLGDDSIGIGAYAIEDATVVSGSVQTAGLHSTGILTEVDRGTATVTSGNVVTTGEGAAGIFVTQAHASPLGNGLAIAPPAPAGRVGSYPVAAVSITSGTVRTSAAGSGGIVARSQDGPVSIVSGLVQTSGADSHGISATGGGAVLIQSGDVATTGARSIGILANQTPGTAGIRIISDSVSTAGESSHGISTRADDGSTDVRSNGTIAVFGPNSAGIIALSDRGRIDIASNSIVASGNSSFGILGQAANGDVAIVSSGSVTVTGNLSTGIDAFTQRTISIDVNSVRATGTMSDAIVANSLGNTIVIRGLVEALDGFAVQANGGATSLSTTAAASLHGRIDLTDRGDTVDNAGTFDALGTSLFGAGADAFNNGGTVRSVNGAAVFAGLEAFANTGRVDMRDNAAGDTLSLGAFSGGTGSRLGVDADLGAGQADVLITGAATGSTALDVNVVGLGIDTAGTLVVDAGAGTSATAFTLAGGVSSSPFAALNLLFDAPNSDFLLVSLPDQPVFETIGQSAMIADFWYEGTDAISAQLEAARDGLASADTIRTSNLTGDGRLGGWVQALAGSVDRQATQTFGNSVFDTGYEQDHRGVQAGLDYQSGGTILGLSFGYGKADAQFDQSFNRVRMEGYNLGAYAAFNSGGFFANAIAKLDWVDADSTPGAGLLAEYEATAWGLRGTAGYRFDTGRLFVEPSVSLSYVNVDIDDYMVGGAAVAFGDIESLRGAAGIRLGGNFRSGNGTFSPFVGVYAIDALSGDARADFTLGQTIALRQDAPGTHGQAVAGIDYSTGRLELFARGEADFAGERSGLSGRAGLRLRF